MDRLLRPRTFETESSDPNATKIYKHWKSTLEHYIKTVVKPVVATEDVAATAAAQEAAKENKKHGLINCISADIYELISECDDYESALAALDAIYIKPTSLIFGRHKLISCKQEPSQSIDKFKEELQRLAKTCDFKAVSAEQNKSEYIRDAFIKGISSAHIRQRLLENTGELSFDDAFNQARALEQAQSHSMAYESNPSGVAAAGAEEDITDKDELAAFNNKPQNGHKNKQKFNKNKNSCWNCGNARHARSQCPARDVECSNCHKPGHFAKVCMSSSASTPSSTPLGAIGAVGQQQHSPALA